MLSQRLRRIIVAVPSYFQRSNPLSPASDFPSVSSLLPRSVVRQQPTENYRSPARLFSTTQYQYDPYTGEDSFTPDNEGCDFNHWLITMDFPKDNPPSREEMISIFEQTCAKVLDLSLEEAKKKIYAICTTNYQGFQATMTIGEVEKFRDLPGVQYIIPDSYVDVEKKLYGGDKYENGVITPGPIHVPTREGFGSLAKDSMLVQEQSHRSETPSENDLTSGEVRGQGSQTSALRQRQGQDRGHGSQMTSPRQDQARDEVSKFPSFHGIFKRDQGTLSPRQGQAQGNKMPSFQGSFKQGQGTMPVRQGQAQESQMPSVQRGYNQSQRTPTHGQGQGSQMPSHQMGYSQHQGAQWQRLPSNNCQGAFANYNQGAPQGNFIQGTQENYSQIGRGNGIPQSSGNYGTAHGQGGQIPSYQMGYSLGPGASVPPYQGNCFQGTPNTYGQWAFANYNQGSPPQGNFPQGPQQNYNQGGQWNFSPPSGGNYSPAQFGHTQCQVNQMPQYQLSYNPGQGAPFPGQWQQCPGCGMLSYQGSYNQGQGTPNPGQWQGQEFAMPSYQASYSHGQGALTPQYQGNYNYGIPTSYGQVTSANFNQGIPMNHNQMGQVNYNSQSCLNYGPTHGAARNQGFGQGQNQIFQQEDRRSDWSNNNNPTDPTETSKVSAGT